MVVSMQDDFKIDLVYLWVDGSDPVWLAKKDAAWEQQHSDNLVEVEKVFNRSTQNIRDEK
jgi:hypothetical protein